MLASILGVLVLLQHGRSHEREQRQDNVKGGSVDRRRIRWLPLTQFGSSRREFKGAVLMKRPDTSSCII